MDFTVILLILVLIVILYLFYVYFIASTSKLVSSAYLMNAVNPISITDQPTVVNFAVGVWVYMNTCNTETPKNLFVLNNSSGTTVAPLISLDLGSTDPTLTVTVTGKDSTANKITLTNNFPVQKWVFVIVSISNNIVDGYLDGRLVTSYQLPLNTHLSVTGATTLSVTFQSGVDAYIYNFQRWAYPMDPQTAQSSYYYGAPSSTSASSYNLSVAVSKGGSNYASASLF